MLGTTALRGVGLAVLLQTGLAGWLRAVSTCAHVGSAGTTCSPPSQPPPDLPTASARVGPPALAMLSPPAYDEVARLIASLVLSRHQPQKPCPLSAHGGT